MLKKRKKQQSVAFQVETCAHRVSLSYWGFKSKKTAELKAELRDAGEERAKECIIEGNRQGELCFHNTDNEEEIRGWWEIIRP